jgi:hypothetical protein
LARPFDIFALEIDGKPALTFAATNLAEAEAICLDPHLRSDLCGLTSSGVPICCASSMLSARAADRREIAAFEHAFSRAPASDEPTMAFLIKVDGVVVFAIDS